MTITHQIVTDAEGQPTAALIPWDEFEVIQAEVKTGLPLEPAIRSMLERRSQELEEGTVKGISSEEMFKRVRARLEQKRASSKSA